MRWFTTEEIYDIFSRLQKVIVVGNSVMRYVVGVLNVLLRNDPGSSAVTDWNFSPKEKYALPVKAALVFSLSSNSVLRIMLLTLRRFQTRMFFATSNLT
jgi:hypothetical protein